MFVAHFGNGDEVDQNVIIEACEKFGELAEITIIPGNSYGHITFKALSAATALLEAAKLQNAADFPCDTGYWPFSTEAR